MSGQEVKVYLNDMWCEYLGLEYTFDKLPSKSVLLSYLDAVIPRMDEEKRNNCISLIDSLIKKGKATMHIQYESNQPGWFIIRE